VTLQITRILSAAGLTLAVSTGCVPMTANSPAFVGRLQLVSAGHTGCAPSANTISAVNVNLDGSGFWTATCNGRSYLCSAIGSADGSGSISCAPAAQQPAAN
jgi:hypothetical protein